MKNSENKPKPRSSIFKEVMTSIVLFFWEDLTSKLGLALLTFLMGILVITRPILDVDGKEIEKSYIPYLIGSILIIVSIVLVISWLRKRKNKQLTTTR